MIKLNERQVKQLEALLQELPMKYGVPLVNLIRSFGEENLKAEANATDVQKEDVPVEVETLS